ncbi:xanthine dehydrogenase family protein subunit M [Kibdelosporangium persicum]|uniref:FAD binding domain in molybdopterin dehydrogenase n=1 Tax=Kibdelosporangium persicum TaxID=2698649 RepID=A0ABX2F089_9PSEU|nr:xanthine dehydrogenase family protein subunit M [Kibdelosporangium persicum]NRN64367.1 FAD binding domain in molybdopterin dehydrogenase [Kibdelosporangium persicum]
MKDFQYARATSVTEAVRLARRPGAAFVAGGTELLNLMKDSVQAPDLVVDVNPVPLAEITQHADMVRIGALARMTDVARHPLVRDGFPLVSQALMASASGQVRNMASIGGNLMQRTRCWYFRDAAMPCNTRSPGSGCPAVNGENRWHAVFGGSDSCIKVHPSDLAVALTALDARVLIDGRPPVPIRDFYVLPGATPQVETVLRHGEMITGVEIPRAAGTSRYVKVRDRASFEFALVSVAVLLHTRHGVVQDVRLAFGGVAPKPWRSVDAEDVLRGRRLTDRLLDEAAEVAVRGASARRHNGFKIELLKRTVRAALDGAR